MSVAGAEGGGVASLWSRGDSAPLGLPTGLPLRLAYDGLWLSGLLNGDCAPELATKPSRRVSGDGWLNIELLGPRPVICSLSLSARVGGMMTGLEGRSQ